MKAGFDYDWALWALGVIQPASPEECIKAILSILNSAGHLPSVDQLQDKFDQWETQKKIKLVHKDHSLYSLTENGNRSIPDGLRKQRDRVRIGLMKAQYHANVKASEGVAIGLGGEAPPSDVSTASKEGSRPVVPGRVTSQTKLIYHPARNYWPRFSEQLNFKVGLERPPSDTLTPAFRYSSFRTLKDLQDASYDPPLIGDLTHGQLALAMGISSQLLNFIRKKKGKFYREFEIGKRGGGKRQIESPRVYLKAIQYWIKTFFFPYLQVHDACHAYLPNRSIVTNAGFHVKKKFVGNVDISNFFGSITTEAVAQTLKSNGIGEKLSAVIADLITVNNHLPQGAPTSPSVSNAYLFSFDDRVAEFAKGNSLSYTRYADDLTLSGDSKEGILAGFAFVSKCLKELNLNLNPKKTRIAGFRSSQRVTGLVVNEGVRPSRKLRRQVRAMFKNAEHASENEQIPVAQLKGFVSYFQAFGAIRDSQELEKYNELLVRFAKK